MPVATHCSRHGRIVLAGDRCPECATAPDPGKVRRAARNRELGRKLKRWERLSARMIRRCNGICPVCGGSEASDDPGSKLTCDLIGGGDHSRATEADCRVKCRRCHGRADGGRR